MALGLDFAVLGPVKDKSPALGWQRFAEHCARRDACRSTPSAA